MSEHSTEETRPTMRDMLDIIHWSCNDECDEESHVFTPAEQGIYKALFEHVRGIVAVQVGEVAAEWSRTVDATVHEAERQVAQAKAEALREAGHQYGVVWGTGVTTEARVGEVLNHWSEHGVGARIRPAAPSEGGES